MNPTIWLPTPYACPTTQQVLGFLIKGGWVIRPPKKESKLHQAFKQFCPNAIEAFMVCVEVPADPTLRDFTRRMTECLVDVAKVEDKPAFEVLTEILEGGFR